MGEDRPRPPDRLHRRHGAGPDRRGLRRTTPTCWSTRRRSARTSTARARETGHSTARQAARTAARGRRQAARADAPLHPLLPARDPRRGADVFENTVVPRDFDAIEIPFPERGEPHLVKAELVDGLVDGLALALVLDRGRRARGLELPRQAGERRPRADVALRPRGDRALGARRGRRRRHRRRRQPRRRRASWPARGLLHIGYFSSLQHAYEKGDLSVVYPLARGSGPVLERRRGDPLPRRAPVRAGARGAARLIVVAAAPLAAVAIAGDAAIGARAGRPARSSRPTRSGTRTPSARSTSRRSSTSAAPRPSGRAGIAPFALRADVGNGLGAANRRRDPRRRRAQPARLRARAVRAHARADLARRARARIERRVSRRAARAHGAAKRDSWPADRSRPTAIALGIAALALS